MTEPNPRNKIFEAVRETSQRILERHSKLENFDEDSPIIYQYTNGADLQGIIESNSIWATGTDYLNDSRELNHGLEITQYVCQNQSSRHTISTKYRSFINNLAERFETLSKYYVACFTKNGDQLSQWRGYGSGGSGYSIGFETKELDSLLKDSTLQGMPILYNGLNRVIYDDSRKNQMVSDFIEGYFEKVVELLTNEEYDENFSTITSYCFMALHDVFSVMKHSAFSEEDEVRAGFYEFIDDSSQVRRRGDLMVPYYSLGILDRKLPIRRIYIGPTMDYKRASEGVRILLKLHGFEDVEVLPSVAPYRN